MTQAHPPTPPPARPAAPPLTPPPNQQPTNGLGLAGFIVSLVGMVLCFGLLCPLGAILSAAALMWKPRGFALAGLILGLAGSVLWGFLLVFYFSRMSFPGYNNLWQAQDAIDIYHYDHNALPDNATGQSLVGSYSDEWNTPYRYSYIDPQTYEITSAGPDRQFGTTDDVVTSANPQTPMHMPFDSAVESRTTDQTLDDAHEIIERTYANDYASPPWHEVQNVLTDRYVDEWGTPIRYNAGEGARYELRSAGPDGLMDTDDDVVREHELGERGEGDGGGP